MSNQQLEVSPKAISGVIFLVLILLIGIPVGSRLYKTVKPGHVSVATLFGQVKQTTYAPGLHIPVNPFLTFHDYDTRNKELKESIGVPSQDQLTTQIDVSIKYKMNGGMATRILEETGTADQVVMVHLTPAVRSIVREQGKTIARAEDFFLETTQEKLQGSVLTALQSILDDKGILIEGVLIRDIVLPQSLVQQIERKKTAEQEVERQKAELERFRTQQEQKVVEAQAKLDAAQKEAETKRVLAEAQAFEIEKINTALANATGYIQLEALKALSTIAKDPAAKLYFMNGDSPMPLPLMNLGESLK